MSNTVVNGVVKFFNNEKGFGFLITDLGDMFLSSRNVADEQLPLLTDGVQVEIDDHISKYDDGEYKLEALSLKSVSEAPKPVLVLDVVDWYDQKKGFGFIQTADEFNGKTAFLHKSVCDKAGIVPGSGMPVKALVETKADGKLNVVSFTWGKAVHEEWVATQKAEKPAAKTKPSTKKESAPAKAEKSAAKPKVSRKRKPAVKTETSVKPVATASPQGAASETAMAAAMNGAMRLSS